MRRRVLHLWGRSDTLYRRRFGIETSYRLLGEAREHHEPLSGGPPPLRRRGPAAPDEWVILKLQWASEGRQGPSGFVVHEEVLPLSTLLELLRAAIERRLGLASGSNGVGSSRTT